MGILTTLIFAQPASDAKRKGSELQADREGD
jgi:hypothetical protein